MTQRILIATDAWHPQVNGVVRTLDSTTQTLRAMGHVVEVVSPQGFSQIPIPFYPEIPICFPRPGSINHRIKSFRPNCVHIATEGPIGLLVRHYCRQRDWNFTTSYHTKFPEYAQTLTGFPARWSYRFLRWFHNRASAIMVATPSLEADLQQRGFSSPIRRWSRGVDFSVFRAGGKQPSQYPCPVLLYVGRVSVEKNIEAFLSLETPGTKVIVGDGPARIELQAKYPQAVFLGFLKGEALTAAYAAADLFVFPSKTDTFGLVMIEAMACGLPVAAFPVTGPIDIITEPNLGALNEDLGTAIGNALATGQRSACIEEARRYSWQNCTQQFVENLVLARNQST